MENNINHQVLDNYSKAYADLLLQKSFKKSNSIIGEEILGFSPIKQINYFILKILFDKWKSEINSLRSPYFDYENAEVKKATQSLMNVLSRNILVKKDDFKSLLEEAVYSTLLLIFSPYEFFVQEISRPDVQQVSISDLMNIRKYVKINSLLLDAYIERFESDGIQAVFSDDAVKIFDEVCETIKDTPEDFEAYQEKFSQVLKLDLNEVYSEPNPAAERVTEKEPQEAVADSINDKFKSSSQTLLDTLDAERKEALIDIHEKKPLDGLKKSITINQRFMFENDLFSGDKDEFEMVVNYLDNCTSNKEAMEFINENYVEKKNWDLEKEEVVEFLTVVNKRFPK
jgi:hypothetical protein